MHPAGYELVRVKSIHLMSTLPAFCQQGARRPCRLQTFIYEVVSVVYFACLYPIVVPGVVLRLEVTQEALAGKCVRCDSFHPSLKIHLGAPPISHCSYYCVNNSSSNITSRHRLNRLRHYKYFYVLEKFWAIKIML